MIRNIIKNLFNNNKKSALHFQQGLDLTGLPIVTLHHGDKKLNFLLDTGATHSIINEEALEDIKYKENNRKAALTGIEGNRQVVRMCTFSFTYKNQEYETAFIINDMSAAFAKIKNSTGVTLHGLLGSSFFKEFQYIIDFNEMIAYSKK